MIFIDRPETDPFFNIAAEEFLLKENRDDFCMLWQNKPTVIIGKHQNALKEVNIELLGDKSIPFIRRISGGGTVYHDMNNINYSLISTGARTDRLVDFRKYLEPIISFLNTLDIQAEFEGKNNLMVQGRKISGNSAHVYKNRVIHHGTLLFNSDLEFLNRAINPPKKQISDKSVESIRKTVANINEFLDKKITLDKFKVLLKKYLIKYHDINSIRDLNNDEINAINQLAESRYKQWEWNYGYSPAYILNTDLTYKNEKFELKLGVKNGKINSIHVNGETKAVDKINTMVKKLVGLPHEHKTLDPYLRMLKQEEIILNV